MWTRTETEKVFSSFFLVSPLSRSSFLLTEINSTISSSELVLQVVGGVATGKYLTQSALGAQEEFIIDFVRTRNKKKNSLGCPRRKGEKAGWGGRG